NANLPTSLGLTMTSWRSRSRSQWTACLPPRTRLSLPLKRWPSSALNPHKTKLAQTKPPSLSAHSRAGSGRFVVFGGVFDAISNLGCAGAQPRDQSLPRATIGPSPAAHRGSETLMPCAHTSYYQKAEYTTARNLRPCG